MEDSVSSVAPLMAVEFQTAKAAETLEVEQPTLEEKLMSISVKILSDCSQIVIFPAMTLGINQVWKTSAATFVSLTIDAMPLVGTMGIVT